jgi:hypothetical protein
VWSYNFCPYLACQWYQSQSSLTPCFIALGISFPLVEDRLAKASNWSPWKARIVLILEELELWDIVQNLVVLPIDAMLMAKLRKRNIKAKRTILDAVKDHIIPHVSGKDFAFQMWQSLCGLYQSPNQNRKTVL